MTRKRRTAAEMAAARAGQREDFERKMEAYRRDHTPEECSCAEKETDPTIFDASWTKGVTAEMSRAQKQIGCTMYVWRTSRDGGVCPRCEANADRVFRYDSPPPGGHPGLVAGCRCIAEPIIPNDKGGYYKPRLPLAPGEAWPPHGKGRTAAGKKTSRFAKILWICIGVVILLLLAGKK